MRQSKHDNKLNENRRENMSNSPKFRSKICIVILCSQMRFISTEIGLETLPIICQRLSFTLTLTHIRVEEL